MLRVGVFGAAGRMGQAVCAAVDADADLELVALVDPAFDGSYDAGSPVRSASPGTLGTSGADVAVDFTVPGAAVPNARWCAANGVHAVIGTTGLDDAELAELAQLFSTGEANCIVAPNFAIGAVLMVRFAELAAPWFETVEIVELHHDAKLDAPSGTARLTAKRIAAARQAARAGGQPGAAAPGTAAATAGPTGSAARGQLTHGIAVHSVRLRGLVAHQEVLLGTSGQTLTIRHDSLDRASFMPGVLLAVKQVASHPGLTVGLEPLLGL